MDRIPAVKWRRRVAHPDDGADWAEYRRAVGVRVREARLRANLTQETLADRSGVGRNTLQRIEGGDPQAPRLGAMWRLARTLGVPVQVLLTDSGEG